MNHPSLGIGLITCALLLATSVIYCSPSESADFNEDQPVQRTTSSAILNDPTDYFRENSLEKLFNGRSTFDEYLLYGMRSLKLVAGYDNDLHRYDSKSDLVRSFVRNLSYTEDIGHLRAHVDASELDLLNDESELTLIENELAQSRCRDQLETVLVETRRLYADFNTYSSSKQLSLINYLDSFGAPSSQLLKGDSMWLGSYQQCSESRLALPATGFINGAQEFSNRYCVANYRSPFWPTGSGQDLTSGAVEGGHNPHERLGSESIKLGICLPEFCNSISIHRHGQRIDELVKLVRLNQIPYNGYNLTHLYCLPDNRSPLRQFSLSARLFILALSSWLTVVMYFSVKYELIRMRHLHSEDAESQQVLLAAEASNSMKIFAFRLSWTKLFQDFNTCRGLSLKADNCKVQVPPFNKCDGQESGIETSDSESTSSGSNGEPKYRLEPDEMMRMIEEEVGNRQTSSDRQQQGLITTNILESMKNTSSRKVGNPLVRPSEATENNLAQRRALHREVSSVVTVNGGTQSPADGSSPASKIDLAVIDGIKVLSMIWLISAHTLLFFIRNISNGRDFWAILRDFRFMSIMAGIFPVDTFFTITGILTAFLKFSKNDGQAMGKASHWLDALVHRYLRFMPMYLIVFWYTRDISEYIGEGPLWDYATTDSSLRSTCKLESFSVPLLFQANFKPIDQHCVKPAWYLANDYQYLLLTPIFMGLIMKSTLLGYSFIGLSIFASLIMQFSTVFFSNEIDDFQTLINFKPMFGTYVLKNLWRLYVLPYNRIPPYLIGILTGHLMYSQNKKALSKSKNANFIKSQSQDSLTSLSSSHQRSTSNILNGSKQQCSIGFIGTLSDYICIKVWTPLILLISIIYLPMLTKLYTQEGLSAKLGTSSIMAIMRLAWSAAISGLIYVCSTSSLQGDKNSCDSFIIRFLSLRMWKPWSKMGLSALLIQWEVISYLAQTQIGLPDLTIAFIAAIILLCILVTYSIALIIYLTLEFPLSQVEHLYIQPIFKDK